MGCGASRVADDPQPPRYPPPHQKNGAAAVPLPPSTGEMAVPETAFTPPRHSGASSHSSGNQPMIAAPHHLQPKAPPSLVQQQQQQQPVRPRVTPPNAHLSMVSPITSQSSQHLQLDISQSRNPGLNASTAHQTEFTLATKTPSDFRRNSGVGSSSHDKTNNNNKRNNNNNNNNNTVNSNSTSNMMRRNSASSPLNHTNGTIEQTAATVGSGWESLSPSHAAGDHPLQGTTNFAALASVKSNDHFGASVMFDNLEMLQTKNGAIAPRRQSYFTPALGMGSANSGLSTANPMTARVRQRSLAFTGLSGSHRNSLGSGLRTPQRSNSQVSDTSDRANGVGFGQDGDASTLRREEEIGASVFACTFLCQEPSTKTYFVLKAVHQKVCLQDAPSTFTIASSTGTCSTQEGGSHDNLNKLRRGSSAIQIRRTASSVSPRGNRSGGGSPSKEAAAAQSPKNKSHESSELLKDLPVHKQSILTGSLGQDIWHNIDGRVALAFTMLQKLGHKCMQNIYAVTTTNTHVCAIGEFFIQGSLETSIGTYDHQKLGTFAKDMVRVLHYAHNHGIAHGHLTLSNIFLREQGQGTVVADFGLAHVFLQLTAQQLYDADYRDVGLFPPEKVTGKQLADHEDALDQSGMSDRSSTNSPRRGAATAAMRRAEAADLWAIGCLLYQLASGNRGRPPFQDLTKKVYATASEERDALFHRIATKEADLSWCTDNDLVSLLSKLLHKDPAKRGPFLTVLRHPYIRMRVDVSRSLPMVSMKSPEDGAHSAQHFPQSKRSASSSKQLHRLKGATNASGGAAAGNAESGDEERVLSDNSRSEVHTSTSISDSASFSADQSSVPELLPIATGFSRSILAAEGRPSLGHCFSLHSFHKQHSSAYGGFEKSHSGPRQRSVLFSVEGFKCSHCLQHIKVASYQCSECPTFRVCRSCHYQQCFVHPADHELICHAVDTTIDDGGANSRSRRGTIMIPSCNLTEREATIFSMTGTLPVALDFERSTRGMARHQSMRFAAAHNNNNPPPHGAGVQSGTTGSSVALTAPAGASTSGKKFDLDELGSGVLKSPKGSPRLQHSGVHGGSISGTSLPSESLNEEAPVIRTTPLQNEAAMMLEETPEAIIDYCLQSGSPELLLSDLQLSLFPSAILNPPMTHLTILDVANNFLTSIPDDIEFLVNLRRLLLGNNRLSELPETIGNLTDLETLDVNHNLLTSLPQSLMFCDQLQVLALDYNDFDEIPTLLADIEVHQVYLAANPRIAQWPDLSDLQNFPNGITIGLDNEPTLFREAKRILERCPNIHVMWNKIYPDEILPSLYLGSLRSAQSQDVYKKLHITHLLTMGRGLEPQPPEGGEHKVVIVDDIEGANIEFSFEEAIAFIDESLSKQTGCLVHCFAGMSRSATTVIAYLMMKRGMRLDEAYCLTRKGRPAIYPNGGFFNQLLSLDAKLYPGQRELDMASMERDKKP